ncbi:potassium transporter KtrB [candidate division KSB1 bacterium]|nr:MAG: potassium transporter KtrB [candidate division KSB1 bacterium]
MLLLTGYACYMLLGWIVLSLPWLHENGNVSLIDNLFTSVSAVSTTGLTTVSTPDSYNFCGELVILILIQLGGLGYMTFGSFLFLITHELKLTDFRIKMSKSAFSVEEDVKVETFIGMVVIYTMLIEAAGAILLYLYFQSAGIANPAWAAIFHSVSAFCTAGFSLFNNSLEGFPAHTGINLVVAALSLLGAMGFIIIHDALMVALRQRKRLTFTSRIILYSTMWVMVIGTFLLYVGEPSCTALPASERFLVSFFQTMTAATTVGFNTIPIAKISVAFTFLITILMVIGASPSGTGGGLKSTTIAVLLGTIRSTLRGREHVTFGKRRIPIGRMRAATASVGTYVILLLFGTFLLSWIETFELEDILFEVASALGTVGLSRGITANLSLLGKLIVITLMFVGRVGALSFGFALFGSATVEQIIEADLEQEDVVL